MASSIAPRIVRAVQLAAYATAMVVLALVAWKGTNLRLPNVGQFAGIIGSGFLGGILNPVTAGADAGQLAQQDGSQLSARHDALWIIATLIGAGSVVAGALALGIHGSQHVNAAASLTALATAFAALFFDTTGLTHTLSTVVGSANPNANGNGNATGNGNANGNGS